jgi:hypothetical protein
VLDDVQGRGFLVEPAGEATAEIAVGVAYEDLDEGAGQLLRLPRRGRLAGTQPHDHVLDPQRLARLHDEVARQAVALIEQADHCHPVFHRRRAGRFGYDRLRDVDDRRLAARLPACRALVAAGEGDKRRGEGRETAGAPHALSGVHAS